MRALFAATVALATALGLPASSSHAAAPDAPAAEPAADGVSMLVLREDGVGGAGRAREYLAAIIDAVAKANGWAGSTTFEYFTDRAKAEPYIAEHDPSFGILSFGAFLGMHEPHKLKVVGTAKAVGSGGGRYYIVSKKHHDIDGCKAGTLASNHVQDRKYIDKVVSAGVFSLADFKAVEATKRPVQTIKAVIRDEADCALIDHAQFESMQSIDGGADLSTVWFSREFPSIVMVAFPKAPAAQVATFRDELEGVCKGEGKKACERTGVKSMVGVDAKAFDAQIAAYEGR